ncbi:major facilitator superfamily transporter [Fusarium subglutinans]|uniref:Major facilitator superfamily transporter n=1 Tax=Gibberella subglutinans TaxID=42677 RepID=A0A8H5PV64_GIBSU|nr:major facilitator superfamily transporter [Fusarium subglutinans]KAF5603836.1 major facilitator superfamily transporter [Fusarium subglutinans]
MEPKNGDKPFPQQRVSQDLADSEIAKPGEALSYDEEPTIAPANHVPNTAEERDLVRKIDFTLLPYLWWMYILAYLDRGDIANATAAGISKSLNMKDNDCSLLVYLFFVGYFLCEVPSNMIMN